MMNLNFLEKQEEQQQQKKPKPSRQKEIIKVRAKVIEIKTKQTIQ
jgi:hypothetical protein